MISEGVGQIWARFKVIRRIQETKMNIWKWIKFRENITSLLTKTLEKKQE